MHHLNIDIEKINSPGVVSSKLWIREGSRSDPHNYKGLHQLLGSLFTRGCGPYDYSELGDLIEGCGASLQCETYEDGILISLKSMANDFAKLLPILGWMIIEPHLKDNQIALEKALTIKAIKRQKENPFYLAFDGWRNLAYSNGPYGHDPLGLIKDLEVIDKEALLSLSTKIITRTKTLVVTGMLPDDLKTEINNIEPFGQLIENRVAKNYKIDECITPVNHSSPTRNINLEFENTLQVVIILGLPTISCCHPDDLLLRLLGIYLGSGMSSLLFLKLREEHGVAYDVGVHHPMREAQSPFLLHASTSASKAVLTLRLLSDIWENMLNKTISKENLSLAKSKYHGLLAHSSQSIAQRAERRALILGRNLPRDYDKQNLLRIRSITKEDLQRAANKHLKNPLLSLCGPKKILMELSKEWKP